MLQPPELHKHLLRPLNAVLRALCGADVYCVGEDALGSWAFGRRRVIDVAGEPIWLAPIEYVIVQKLRYLRESGAERHLRDIAAMRRVSDDLIDSAALDGWVTRLGLQSEWENVLRFNANDAPPGAG